MTGIAIFKDGRASTAELEKSLKNTLDPVQTRLISVDSDSLHAGRLEAGDINLFILPGTPGTNDYHKLINPAGNQRILKAHDNGVAGLYLCAGAYYASRAFAYHFATENYMKHGTRSLNLFNGYALGPQRCLKTSFDKAIGDGFKSVAHVRYQDLDDVWTAGQAHYSGGPVLLHGDYDRSGNPPGSITWEPLAMYEYKDNRAPQPTAIAGYMDKTPLILSGVVPEYGVRPDEQTYQYGALQDFATALQSAEPERTRLWVRYLRHLLPENALRPPFRQEKTRDITLDHILSA